MLHCLGLCFAFVVCTSQCVSTSLRSSTGDNNNCWDYCFGREETLATSLVNIVKDQRLDGIDIDYEYCYDIYGSQSGRCSQRTSNYSDEKAQTFLMLLTSKLRQKLDALGSGYELTHAPMDADLVPSSVYYQILKDQHMNLNFLMPQFYNGITKAVADGVTRGKQGRDSAISLYDNLANDLFPGEPHKVRLKKEAVLLILLFVGLELSHIKRHCNPITGRIRLLCKRLLRNWIKH
jgi:hypothetical protein